MMDLDAYWPSDRAEKFLDLIRVKTKQKHSTIEFYVSTASPTIHWIQNIYNFYNNTELME